MSGDDGDAILAVFPTRVGVNRHIQVLSYRNPGLPHTRGGEPMPPRIEIVATSRWTPVNPSWECGEHRYADLFIASVGVKLNALERENGHLTELLDEAGIDHDNDNGSEDGEEAQASA